MKRQLILASRSPRRRELLSLLHQDFVVVAADIEEELREKEYLEQNKEKSALQIGSGLAELLAREKAQTILRSYPSACVIGADTVVITSEGLLGKPKDEAEAYAMLRSLAGRAHDVVTGVCVCNEERCCSFASHTSVHFYPWSERMEREVRAYIASGQAMDKAGAYGIQEEPGLWVRRIEGDFYNIIGLPVAELHQILDDFLE